MLEYNFGKLDNDFITVWSRFLMSEDISYIIKDLEHLAELAKRDYSQEFYSGNTTSNEFNY